MLDDAVAGPCPAEPVWLLAQSYARSSDRASLSSGAVSASVVGVVRLLTGDRRVLTSARRSVASQAAISSSDNHTLTAKGSLTTTDNTRVDLCGCRHATHSRISNGAPAPLDQEVRLLQCKLP